MAAFAESWRKHFRFRANRTSSRHRRMTEPDPTSDIGIIKIPQRSSLLPDRGVLSFPSEAPTAPTSNSGPLGLPRGDPMKRREFITLLGGAAVAWPLAAQAQPSPVRPLIGVLSPLSAAAATRNIAALRSALRDLGYVEGRNVTLALRYGDGSPERMPLLAQELVALNPDVVIVGASSSILAVHNATRTIPIVALIPEDPVAAGLAHSIAKPGGNVTGSWNLGDDLLVGKKLDFFKLAVMAAIRA